jgi:hypothetical protein
MEDGINRGWRQQGSFSGDFGRYTVQGFKYLSERGEIAWHSMSWPKRDPVHTFWVSGETFYKVTVHPRGDVSNRQVVEIFGIIENVDPAERSAVLEAIQVWEKQLQVIPDPESPEDES